MNTRLLSSLPQNDPNEITILLNLRFETADSLILAMIPEAVIHTIGNSRIKILPGHNLYGYLRYDR